MLQAHNDPGGFSGRHLFRKAPDFPLLVNVFLKNSQRSYEAPGLADLDNGDLKYQVDFREIYASVLEKWLEADARAILNRTFPEIGLV